MSIHEIVLAILLVAALPSCAPSPVAGEKSAVPADIAAAKRALRAIETAQQLCREGEQQTPLPSGELRYATTTAELSQARITFPIDASLASGKSHGYLFRILPSKDPFFYWSAEAWPDAPDVKGPCFFIDESGVLRRNDAAHAGPSDAPTDR